MPYAREFRIAVANAYDECGSSIEVAEQFGCSESWVRDLSSVTATDAINFIRECGYADRVR